MSEFLHGTQSPWGYIYDAENLAAFITEEEFNAYTARKFSGDCRVAANIPSATASIRNYCGWHIAPSLTCGMVYRVADLRDAFVGPDLIVQIPATFVSVVSKVILNAVLDPDTGNFTGDNYEEFDLENNGILRVYDVSDINRKSRIFVKYTAGFGLDQIPAIKELTANRVTHAVTSSYGVMSEAAGGVSVTYSASWAGNTRSTALPDDSREVLEPYRVRRFF